VQAAISMLKAEGNLEKVPTEHTIASWIKGRHSELYSQIRERAMDQIERDMSDRYRGVAAQAVEATELAVQKSVVRLKAGAEKDPARAAANLAKVADTTLQDYRLLEDKPTAISESRGLADVLRQLTSMGVLVPQEQPELEAGEVDVEPEDVA
jgi:hypothetical protein